MPNQAFEPTPDFIARLERELAGSIGAASAHVMLSKVVTGEAISLEEAMQMADETQQAKEYSQQLELASSELRRTALKLEEANTQLRELDRQKDDFLSQVSHEVRTPMTSIRSFSEILLEPEKLSDDDRSRFVDTDVAALYPPGRLGRGHVLVDGMLRATWIVTDGRIEVLHLGLPPGHLDEVAHVARDLSALFGLDSEPRLDTAG